MANLSSNTIAVKYVIDDGSIANAIGSFKDLTDEERKAILESKRLREELGKTGKEGSSAAKGISGQFGAMAGIAKAAGPVIAGVFVVDKLVNFGKEIIATTAKFEQMQKAINFASGSVEKGNANFKFLQDTAQKLGLDLQGMAEGYKSFSASSILAGQSIEETNRQFEAVSKAVAALGLGTEDAKGVFLALGQVMSKGNVQAEELRGQIGERLPGAFNLAANAMGVTTAELNKMLEQGQVGSKEFLPKFATELEKTFGAKAQENLKTLTGAQNNFNSSMDKLILAIGGRLEPFLKGAYNLAAGIAAEIAKSAGGKDRAAQRASDIERIAAARTGNEIIKEQIKLGGSLKAQDFERSRRQIAGFKLAELQAQIDEQSNKVMDLKIAKSGDVNGAATERYNKAVKELDILYAMDAIYTKMVEVTVQQVKPKEKSAKETKAEMDAAKKLYETRLKTIDIEEKIARLKARTSISNSIDLATEEFLITEKFNKQRLEADRKAARQGVEGAKEAARMRVAETNLAFAETARAQQKEVADAKKAIQEQMEAMRQLEAKRRENADDSAKAREEQAQYELELKQKQADAFAEIDKKSAEETKKLQEELREAELQQFEKSIELAQTLTNGFVNLYNQRLDAQLSRIQKQYDEEIRLAGDNEQKVMELNEKKRQAEKEIKTKQFRADQINAVANVLFQSAPQIVKYSVTAPPLAAIVAAIAAAQTGFILAQPVPEFAKGTRGKAHKGKAIVGEEGRELVVTESGKTYLTPGTASLVDFKERSHILPADITERMMGSYYANRTDAYNTKSSNQLERIAGLLENMPVHALELNERGFEKFIRTPRRSTKILNTRNG
jgi:tape measure domain-containing protein